MLTTLKSRVKNRRYGDWLFAIFFAALLNITMFGLMPGLVQHVPEMCEPPDSFGDIVQVIRIKSPESEVEKKEIKPPEPELSEPPRQIKELKEVKPVQSDPVRLKPKLAFELNMALPKNSTSLLLPPLEHFSMEVDAPVMEDFSDTSVSDTASDVQIMLPSMKDIYGTGELDAPITPVVKVAPLYPIRAKRRGIEGWVKIRFRVDKSGMVNTPEVLQSHPENIFDDSVISCVKRWKFKPGKVGGVKVNTIVETTIRFKLE